MIDRHEACERLAEEPLSKWEEEFIICITDWEGGLTDRQMEVLAKLVRQYLHEDCEPSDFL
jgi:hypothetical protein